MNDRIKKILDLEKAGDETMEVNIEIDSLTNCLTVSDTGEKCDTDFKEFVHTITNEDAQVLQNDGWLFDWSLPQHDGCQVYGLYVVGSDELQGLIALKHYRESFFTYVELVEAAPHNRINHKYLGVGAHLFAIACKFSFEIGNEGYVCFDAKTKLIDHYHKELGANVLQGQRMVIDTINASKLVRKYFKEEKV